MTTIDPAVRTAVAAGPIDAVVLFREATSPELASAQRTLSSIDSLPLGAARKTAAFDAVRQIGDATLAPHRRLLGALVRAHAVAGVDELRTLGVVRVRGASAAAIERLAAAGASSIMLDSYIVQNKPLGPVRADAPAPTSDAVDGAAATAAQRPAADAPSPTPSDPSDPNAIWMDWGVRRMHAPAAWAQGITGAGVTIGSLDTGVYTSHPVLQRNFRGTNADGSVSYDYNWKDVVEELPDGNVLPDGSAFDPADAAGDGTSRRAIDLNGHGTHTTGSAVGWDPRHITGVAPDAKFIAARALGNKGGSMFALISAMEWFMAPTKVDGSAPRPDLAPDIVTNSWGGAPMGNDFLWMALRNWRRSGIIPVFAAGNALHPNPREVAVPGMYPETITVGASDLDDKRAFFSMYGPSDYARDHKPEVMAPGHWTYSTLPNGDVNDVFPEKMDDGTVKYFPASGTSMATPHVAGAMALYLQAHPGSSYADVLRALKSSGNLATNPNDEQGWGVVDCNALITPDSIAANATRTGADRVAELDAQVAKAKVWMDGVREPGWPKRLDGMRIGDTFATYDDSPFTPDA